MNENITEVHRILDEKSAKRVAKLFDNYKDEDFVDDSYIIDNDYFDDYEY